MLGTQGAAIFNDGSTLCQRRIYASQETGTYYLRARYYDPKRGRFTQEDTLALNIFTCSPQILLIAQVGNKYVYCANNPVMYSDPSGNRIDPRQTAVDWEPVPDPGGGGESSGNGSPGGGDASESGKPNLPPLPDEDGSGQTNTGGDGPTQDAVDYDESGETETTPSNNQMTAEEVARELLLAPSNVIDYFSATAYGIEKYMTYSVGHAIRPPNIGIGIFARQQAAELAAIGKGAKFAKTLSKFATVGCIVADVGIGIYENLHEEDGYDAKEIILDAAVDTVVSTVPVVAAMILGSAIPVVGHVVGFGLGLLYMYYVDIEQNDDGQTRRDEWKEGVNNLW